jgi:hypothetical protein
LLKKCLESSEDRVYFSKLICGEEKYVIRVSFFDKPSWHV